MTDDERLIGRLLDFMERELIPETEKSVSAGNKMFGAGMLRKDDLSTILVGTNNEIENPLWHGEVHTIKLFHELPAAQRPRPEEILFVASHEPCSLCLSAITWAGYDNFYYLFSHEDSRDSFNIGHDLQILKEVFRLDPGGYARANKYWTGHSLRQMIGNLDEGNRKLFTSQVERISDAYENLSAEYQSGKHSNDIPLN